MSPDFSDYPKTPFTIYDESDLIGGPVAQGRIGDVLLSNDRIRVVIQKPSKNSGLNSFGGNIIDADLLRDGKEGYDNFGSLFPLVNIEWTVNYYNYEVISTGENGSPKTLRAYGKIDVYDYLDLDFIGEVAEAIVGQRIQFSNRFDDRRNPFEIYDDLKGVSREVVTDYILEPGKNYVKIETTYMNDGDGEARMPVGQFLNGSGEVSTLVPGVGFSPDLMTQVGTNTPAVIYAAFPGAKVSYGFFYDASSFKDPQNGGQLTTTSVSFSGLTGIMFGEEFLKLAPPGGGDPIINFAIPPKSSRTVTSYFVVGGPSAGSVMDAGLGAVGAASRLLSGSVKDAGGRPVKGATVAVMSGNSTLITYTTDAKGIFSGYLPTGGNEASRLFGKGKYRILVEHSGHHKNGTTEAGECLPQEIDLMVKDGAQVVCTLGETTKIELAQAVIDAETGAAIPARLTIVGEDPSPNKTGVAGRFYDTIHWEPVFGIVDLKYIGVNGTFDLTGEKSFNLEPGTYLFVFSRGPEYDSYEVPVIAVSGETFVIPIVSLARVVKTPGYISADMHLHSITSPDSSVSLGLRALSAAAEGIDILQSTDHDYLTDFSGAVAAIEDRGLINRGSIKTSVGEEITPNHYGHINTYPLEADPSHPDMGAIDWSASELDAISPSPDYGMSVDEIIEKVLADPKDKVIQLNHIMDNPTGMPLACGWVTSPFYMKDFGVAALSSYADPIERRMQSRSDGGTSFPIEYGGSGLVTTRFTAIELMIGQQMHDTEKLLSSSLPTWFNLLNLGVIATAVSSSDSHHAAPNPMGLPRNFIASSVDPDDGFGGSHREIDLGEYARNINAHRVTVSAGPIVMMHALSGDGKKADIGDVTIGRKHKITVSVKAPDWAWFDTVEIFSNTEPVPVDDATGIPMQGTAADPAEFYKPYRTPKYSYLPTASFRLSDGTLEGWKEEGGLISAEVSFELEVNEDTWVVAMARGTKRTEGYRSLFPVRTNVLKKSGDAPDSFDPLDLSSFHADKKVGASAWGFTNPIFIDVDGDGFISKYVREGISPIK
jgi:hypothetical protein